MPKGWRPEDRGGKRESPIIDYESYCKMSLEEKKKQRFNVLYAIYKKAEGSSNYYFEFENLIWDLPVDRETTRDILIHLMDAGLLEKNYQLWEIMLTHKGVVEVEQALSKPESATANRQKVRILFVTANPLNTHPLELIKECNNVRDRIALGEYGDQFDFDQRHEVSVSEMDKYLLDYKPQVLHFSGHGSNDGIIIFQDPNKESEETSIKALADLFRIVNGDKNMNDDTKIKLVFLNACYSEKQAIAISKYVDCVVGMTTAVTDDAARIFAESFYQAIGFGKSIKTAFELGRNKVARLNIPEDHTPKLKHMPEIDPSEAYLVKGQN